MTTRSYTNAFEVVDQTLPLITIPQSSTLLSNFGVFTKIPVAQFTVTFEELNQSLGFVTDQVRYTKPQSLLNDVRKLRSYPLTNHQLADAIRPQDLIGKSAYGDLANQDTEAQAMARKLAKIRRYYDQTFEMAGFRTLQTGTAWAPGGSIAAINFYTDAGLTQTSVNFVFGTATTDIVAKCEAVIASIQDSSADGANVTGVVGFASPEFFSALIAHAKVQTAYQYFTASEGQSILRNRAGNDFSLNRRFKFGGIEFIEVRQSLNGTRFVDANTCIFAGIGDEESAVRFAGPHSRFGGESMLGEDVYAWSIRDPRMTEISIESEANFLHVLKKPGLYCVGTVS
jgi:hypothetical protein